MITALIVLGPGLGLVGALMISEWIMSKWESR